MQKNKKKTFYVPDEREKNIMKNFKRITGIPYLLVFLALLMPFATVSCSGLNLQPKKATQEDGSAPSNVEMKKTVLMEVSFYQLVSGVDLIEQSTPEGREQIQKLEKTSFINSIRKQAPEFPKMPGAATFAVVFLGVFLSALFAQFTPLGSIALSVLTWISMWGALSLVRKMVGLDVINVEPGIGIYAATFMIFFGIAMNFASIIRPIILEVKARRAAKKNAAQ